MKEKLIEIIKNNSPEDAANEILKLSFNLPVIGSLPKQDADYLWSLMPEWVKDNGTEADAYDPMFFGTLSREGDIKVSNKVRAILFGQ